MPRALRRFGRSIRSDPWYSISVVVTIGLGIGISTSAFTVLDRLALRSPTGVRAPRELRRILVTEPASPVQPVAVERNSFSYPEIRVILQATSGQGEVTSYWNWPSKIPIRLNTEVVSARVLGVSTNYFSVLGVSPNIGRTFSAPSALATIEAGPREVVISEAFWTRALGRRPDVMGSTVDLHHLPLRVIGVAPAGFDGIGLDGPDIWVPAEFVGPESYGPKWREDRNGTVWAVVIRKAPSVRDTDIKQRVQVGMLADAESLERSSKIGPTVLWSLQRSLAFDFQKEMRFALALWAVSLVVLVTTAINAGGLFLVRGLEQQRNTAVALALGGRRFRIVSSRVVEGLALALAGGLLGVLLSKVGSGVVRITLANYIHYTEGPIDYRPLGYGVLLALLVGAVASALPALRATRIDLKGLLDEGGLGGGREVRKLTTIIHCVQLGFAVIVLYGAALFVQSGRRARATPLGMDLDNVIQGYAFLAKDGVPQAAIKQYWERVTAEMEPVPSVEAVALTRSLPFSTFVGGPVFTAGGPSTGRGATWSYITPDYTRVLRMRLLTGRELTRSDVTASEPVTLINRSGAAQIWGGQSPLGQCLRGDDKPASRCIRVVGVVEDSRRMELTEAETIQLFLPLAQGPSFPIAPYFLVRAKPGMRQLAVDRFRRVLAAQAPPGTQISIGLMAESFEGLIGQWVRSARLLTLFALLAGLATFIGIYGSMTYDLLRRRRELGIRLALGAQPAQLTRGVVRTGLRWSLYGLAIGSVGAVWLAVAVRALLFGTTPLDAGSLAAAVVMVLAIGSLAAWLGARRAAVKDPVFLLRNNR